MPMPSAMLQESDMDKAVKAAAKKLAPDVQWIRYDVTSDWSRDRADFLPNHAIGRGQQRNEARKDSQAREGTLSEKLQLDDSDLLSYFSYRSRSEQAMIKESAWSKR